MTSRAFAWRSRHTRRAMVTLIEAVMTITIMGLLAAIAVPRVGNLLRRQRLDLAAKRIASDIQLVRTAAIRDKTNYSVSFDVTNKQYTLQGQAGDRVSTGTYVIRMKARNTDRIDLAVANFNNTAQLAFNKFGVPVNSGTIVINDGVEKAVLSVSATTGRVSTAFAAYP